MPVRRVGESPQPKAVVKLVVELIDPQPGHSVYELAPGAVAACWWKVPTTSLLPCGLLLGDKPNVLFLRAREELGHMGHCQAEPLLNNMGLRLSWGGDTLVEPKHLDGDYLIILTRVIANPPFSAKQWWSPLELAKRGGQEGTSSQGTDYAKQVSDLAGRLPTASRRGRHADLAFAQHMLASLKADGRKGIILPHGPCSAAAEEGKTSVRAQRGLHRCR